MTGPNFPKFIKDAIRHKDKENASDDRPRHFLMVGFPVYKLVALSGLPLKMMRPKGCIYRVDGGVTDTTGAWVAGATVFFEKFT